jgi:membrane-anchored protein YejM (alkaline phosphatase superfamily)
MYPTGGAKLFRRGANSVPGLMHSVNSNGYATGMYMPHAISFESERKMYSMLGLDRVVLAAPNRQMAAQVEQNRWRQREQQDESALGLMLDDITRWHEEDRRYAVMFLPQIAHGPWIDVTSGGKETNLLERGRALLRLQDQSLGKLIERLQQNGRLEKTLIVVTADHGIRTAVEDPSFHGGALDDYTFNVPLLVFAPGLLNSTTSVPWVTSHIDIAPTILDLLDIENGREFEQGSPIWDDRLNVRVTYLLANDYFGVDGYHQIDKFFEWNQPLSTASQNSSLAAGKEGHLAAGTPEYNVVRARIEGLNSIQRTWFIRAIQ